MSAQTTYKWLEPKPYKKRSRQLGIKGRNMIVWNLVANIVVSGKTPEYVAQNYRLPLEAVQEALDYYYANKDWIDEEVDEEDRECQSREQHTEDGGHSQPVPLTNATACFLRMASTHINLAERSGNLVEAHRNYDPRIIFFYFIFFRFIFIF